MQLPHNYKYTTQTLPSVLYTGTLTGTHTIRETNTEKNIEMNDNAELYMKSNTLQKRDAAQSLQEYSKKITWKMYGDRVLDIGCGDGSVTADVLKLHLPTRYSKLVGCDISQRMVQFANEHYGDERTVFKVMDIEGSIPKDMYRNFDHVFSFYAMHWVKYQDIAFSNIYNLLSEHGDCLLVFLGHMPMYDVFRLLSRTSKWRHLLKDVDLYISPYHDSKDPEKEIRRMMDKIGFRHVHVECQEKSFVYNSLEDVKKAVTAVNPFQIPEQLNEEFMEDYVEVLRELRIIDHINYNLEHTVPSKSSSSLSPKTIISEVEPPPLDTIIFEVLSLRVPENPSKFIIRITFFGQLILSSVINSSNIRDDAEERTIAREEFHYDPSDYERMCLLADTPLVVNIHQIKRSSTSGSYTTRKSFGQGQPGFGCNIDILPLFIDKEVILARKRMRPFPKPSALNSKSWENLPLLGMKIRVRRNEENKVHHEVLRNASHMKLTLVGVFNTTIAHDDQLQYVAASLVPIQTQSDTGLILFDQGRRLSKKFSYNSFYPKWESLRSVGDAVISSDEKLVYNLEDIQNDDGIEMEQYLDNTMNQYFTTIWGSFHRTLLLKNSEQWLWQHLTKYKWPMELHISDEFVTYGFMAFLNLNKLLYPGETTVRLAVPLQWLNAELMLKCCKCEPLVPPKHDKKPASSAVATSQASNTADSQVTSLSTDRTGEVNAAFIIVEVQLARPLFEPVAPTVMTIPDLNEMLRAMEEEELTKRRCNGRGQLERDWQATVRAAVVSLRNVPYYGSTDLCVFNRQLSETRTRVELMTTFGKEAAVYMNNNFVVQECLHSDCTYEETLMLVHACLMKSACATMATSPQTEDIDPTILAARHARQMRDTEHALDMYLRAVVERPNNPNYWRELSTCLRDLDRDWAIVCINKAVVLDPRHPLTLLAKGCIVHEEDPPAAEPFFVALLVLHPFWFTGWVATSVYYYDRELFYMAERIMECAHLSQSQGYTSEDLPRSWQCELGDWWDTTPLLPEVSVYHDAADLLLRIRALKLAEICIARGQVDKGVTGPYFHQMALCYRLRDNYKEALCHARLGLSKCGEICYLKAMEAECLFMLDDHNASMTAFENAFYCTGAYSLLLSLPCREAPRARTAIVELIRRQPSAYAWMALADDWLKQSKINESGDKSELEEKSTIVSCAIACAVQALKWDRRFAKAWLMLYKLVKPSARRQYCRNMAIACGQLFPEDATESNRDSQQSLCHRLGTTLNECRCESSDDDLHGKRINPKGLFTQRRDATQRYLKRPMTSRCAARRRETHRYVA